MTPPRRPDNGRCSPAPWAGRERPPARDAVRAVDWGEVREEGALADGPVPPDQEPEVPEEDEVARAHAEAERVLAVARRDAEAVLDAARSAAAAEMASARSAGWEDGARKAREEAGALLRAAVRSMRRARAERSAMLRSLSADIADVAMTVAARVLGRELEASPDEVVGLARRLVGRAGGPGVLRVRPEDAPLLEAEPLPPGVSLSPDPTLGPGDLRLEAPDGTLDATVAGRFSQVGDALREGDGVGG